MRKKRLIHIALAASAIILLGLFLGNIEKGYKVREIKSIEVFIDDEVGNYFITEKDVIRLLTQGDKRRIIGMPADSIDLRALESDLEKHLFVQDAEVYRDLHGNLIARVEQCRPVARLNSERLPDRYISDLGLILPVSRHFTARVVMISGPWADDPALKDLNQSETGLRILELLRYIEDDEFWKAQVAGMRIDKAGNVTLLPQVGRERLELGVPVALEEKFRKLVIFYKEILPVAGWNTYTRVNVEFKNQIVCE
jgi:cell division protein FtsQ